MESVSYTHLRLFLISSICAVICLLTAVLFMMFQTAGSNATAVNKQDVYKRQVVDMHNGIPCILLHLDHAL